MSTSGIPEFTTVVGLDREHIEELRAVWPTWVMFRPEIMRNPLLWVVDAFSGITLQELQAFHHQNARAWWWDWPTHRGMEVPAITQRERMLTGLVWAADSVETPYYLKIDTDVAAMGPGRWIETHWFEHDPVFVTSPWGYTKPADAIHRLDKWGDSISEMAVFPRLNIPFDPSAPRVRHRRIISYVFFGRTDWTCAMQKLTHYERMPVPSQDTFLWYCAARRGDFFRTVKMKNYGWRHINGLKKLQAEAMRALQHTGREAMPCTS